MSLAMYAAPFDETHNDDNYIHKKKQSHNKTQKMFPKEGFGNGSGTNTSYGSGTNTNTNANTNFNSKKVNSVLEHLHNKSAEDDEDEDNEPEPRTFSPPPPPQSSGAERKSITETYKLLGNTPQPSPSENDLDLNNYQSNYHNNKSMESYYKKMLPPTNHSFQTNHLSNNQNYANHSSNNHPYYKYESMDFANSSSQDVLLQKLNYMIHLLEEQQDERTNNVTEEVVLYSFLGIFIIFIADSFVRIGKYVR